MKHKYVSALTNKSLSYISHVASGEITNIEVKRYLDMHELEFIMQHFADEKFAGVCKAATLSKDAEVRLFAGYLYSLYLKFSALKNHVEKLEE